ncbi:MAG: hypothetical protein VCA73_00535 [Roseibacillus sp.]
MSDEAQPSESPKDALLGLTSLDFGPAWARGGDDKKKGDSAEGKGKRHRDDRGEGRRGDDRQGEGRRDDRRGQGRRDDRRDGKGGGRRFDNRDKGDRGNYNRGGRGRRDDDRGRGPREREEIPPPDGFTAEVMPVEDGLDGLAKEILAGGRTYAVFDLAKLVLGARERFNVSFRSKAEGAMHRCKKDGSLWLTKEEALYHFWHSDWCKDYYEEVVSDAEPPRGNFQTVARCGISGEWLGPPNYHGYQPALAQMHRERFGHMSLDAYKRKIRMERGEEAVAAWLDKMSKRISYRPTGGVRPEEAKPLKGEATPDGEGEASEEAPPEDATAEAAEAEAVGESAEIPAEEDVADATTDEPVEETSEESADVVTDELAEETSEENADETPDESVSEDDAEEEEDPDAAERDSTPQAPPAALLEDMREVERHFVENHFDDAFQTTNRAWVGGNIPGNHLSPGLLSLLRESVAEERRYPGRLTPMLCRQLSGRHVAVFKWRRKLKAGPSRPHPVPEDIAIADRPMSLLNWITENSGKKLDLLWKSLLPKDVSDKEKMGWYHDLHWLLNQGYVLLMADSTVHRAKKPGEDGDSPPARKGKAKQAKRAKQAKQAAKKVAGKGPRKEKAEPQETPAAVEVIAVGDQSSGLYALGGRTLNGTPKSLDALTGRGLWPMVSRLEVEGEEDDDEGENDWD